MGAFRLDDHGKFLVSGDSRAIPHEWGRCQHETLPDRSQRGPKIRKKLGKIAANCYATPLPRGVFLEHQTVERERRVTSELKATVSGRRHVNRIVKETENLMIAIIDYQMGNLRSVQKAFEKVGHEAVISPDPAVIARADKIVLPGVGAFEDAIAELRRRDLIQPIRDAIDAGKPFLGICLGLQLLFDVSYENGEHEGLGILPGKVVRFEVPPEFKVPHMGWNAARICRPAPILAGIEQGTYFYFVHSYYVLPDDSGVVAIEADYHRPFCAMAWRDNVFATQFHPEKSQCHGLRLLQNFAELGL
jgi:glutamine amidotransferase